ncbi:MAG: MFS transporter [Bacteroidetes bacterium GWF2_38_335]|nr:MAG: MFS transporter [Bacteroidetes bacterium GWF2_38_335]OFY77089.1 MAG: MFS transporter [Bacteroidetes bacterium RIFOXYA12_FULL_38_20]HBS84979.1 MFS transporter [Bacteroidales bacterium]
MNEPKQKNKAWTVTSAGLAINLALGILYAWSVLKEAIHQSIVTGGSGSFSWDEASLNDPYAVCILAFAFSMVFAGRIQDTKGPAFTAKIGGVLVGTGFIIASLSTSYWGWLLGFGLLGGMGIGFGYSATTPAALKWFPSSKTGLIAGIVVSGFGLAPVYIAPLTSTFIKSYGITQTMMILGISFLVIVTGLAFILKNPPAGYVPVETSVRKKKKSEGNSEDFKAKDMLRTTKFYIIWVIFFIGSGAGLMIIGNISGMAKASLGESAFIAVAIMAIGNASGRVVAGIVSDKIAKSTTLFIILLFQSFLMFLSYAILDESTPALTIVLLATFIGFNYGTNLSLFPSFVKGFWGMKNFGVNYGILMTAWGLGGFVFSRLSQMLLASTGDHLLSFVIAGSCLAFCLFLTLILLEIKSMN